MIDAQF